MQNKIQKIILLVLSLLGVADTTYLSAKLVMGEPVKCTILSGCDVVTASSYSTIFGIPMAVLGLAYYLAILAYVIRILVKNNIGTKYILPVAVLTGFGFLFSVYLLYLQIFVIEALCVYCLASFVTSASLFVASFFMYRKQKALEINNSN